MKKLLLKNYINITNIIFVILFLCLISVFRPISVHGESMCPTLQNGDTLICNTKNTNPKIGDIVVIKPSFKAVPDKFIIKRVIDIKDNQIFIQGDNTNNSYDSRNFGWINIDQVFGVVIQ